MSKDRITPASAGKTNFRVKRVVLEWDHPRECGKNHSSKLLQAFYQGSPPRVREKRY